jgi:hypothetical protein
VVALESVTSWCTFRCIATNSLLKKTKHSKIVQLMVSSTPMKTVAPIFLPLDILPNATVLVGENINLYCAVTGWPIPTVQWLNSECHTLKILGIYYDPTCFAPRNSDSTVLFYFFIFR